MDTPKRSLRTALIVEGTCILFLGGIVYSDLTSVSQNGVFWVIFVGLLMIILGLLALKYDIVSDRLNEWLQRAGNWLNISSFQMFLLITGPVFTILAINAAGFSSKMHSPYVAVIAWLTGIALAVYGGWNRSEEQTRLSTRTFLWFAIVTILAFLIRGLATDQIPILLNGDEASAGMNATSFINGDWDNPFITGWFSFPSLYFFLQSLSLRAFGHNVEALRIPSAFIGALTVGVVYLCGKTMFGHKAGLFAALILASLHFHIHFSRQGLNNIWDGLWFTLTIALLWYGWKFHRRWAYLLAGLGLGFSQYFYATSKVLIVVLFTAGALAFMLRRAQFKYETPNFVAASIVALAIFLPLAWFYLNTPHALWAPFTRVSVVKEIFSSGASFGELLFQRMPESLAAYTHAHLAGFYQPGTPILRPLGAAFFYLGITALFLQDRDSRCAILTLWLLAFALMNSLSWTFGDASNPYFGPASQRYVASAPACALIAGYGLDKFSSILAEMWPKIRPIVQRTAYIVLMGIVVSDLLFYFVEFTVSSYVDELDSNAMAAYQAGNYLKDQPADTQVIVFGTPRMRSDSPAIHYLAPQIRIMDAPDDETLLTIDQTKSPNLLFIFLPEYREEMEIIEKLYPNGKLTSQQTWNGGTLFWVYDPTAR